MREGAHSMGRSKRAAAPLLLCALLFAAACGGDDANPFVLIPYTPPMLQDMQDMSTDGGFARPVDPYREDRPRCEGAALSCLLPGAIGACVDGRCQLVVCEEGRGDCDGDPTNGCEVDLTLSASCGSCFETCSELQTCQRHVTGYACSVGVVCEAGRFDLDARQETGCEFEARALEPVKIAQPIALGMALTERVALLPLSQGAPLESIASFQGFGVGFDGGGERVVQPPGGGEDGAMFVSLPDAPTQEDSSARSLSLDVVRLEPGEESASPMFAALDVWQDAAYLYQTVPDTQGLSQDGYGPLSVRSINDLQAGCEEGASLRLRDGVVRGGEAPGSTRLELVTASGLFGAELCQEDVAHLCLDAEAGFHSADYLRWFYPTEVNSEYMHSNS